MNYLNSKVLLVLSVILFFNLISAQEIEITPNLSKIVTSEGWSLFNRAANIIETNGQSTVEFNAQPGDGIARLENFEFTNGIIEADIKGKDVRGRSFVGIAFRVVDDLTYDAVYFRPFNFQSDDSLRKSHCVQYISHPNFTWSKLRREFTGKYENFIDSAPDPNSLFHIKIVVEKPKVSVYVNKNEQPSLVVEELTGREGGSIGLWMGNNSDGAFKNLKVIKNN